MRFKEQSAMLAVSVVLALWCVRLSPSSVLAEPPEWYTCADSSAFEPRREFNADAVNVRNHQPSAGAKTSADLAAHARLAAMSYAMYEADAAGGDPLDALDRGRAVYKKAADWKVIAKRCMDEDFSWAESGREYMKAYRRVSRQAKANKKS